MSSPPIFICTYLTTKTNILHHPQERQEKEKASKTSQAFGRREEEIGPKGQKNVQSKTTKSVPIIFGSISAEPPPEISSKPASPHQPQKQEHIPSQDYNHHQHGEARIREEKDTNSYTYLQTSTSNRDEALLSKLYAIAEAVADRAEMHAIIGQQRNDWNKLLLSSINSITLSASLMAGISSIPVATSTHLNISSALLFTTATGMMLAVNKIQPSQLAEEQRKATQLYRQLEKSIQTTIALGSPTKLDVAEAMEKVLAIDRAYPLPLLPLLEKFPKKVEPAVWWPRLMKPRKQQKKGSKNNGWSKELEQEMKGTLRLLKTKDQEQYRECGELVVKINKTLAISGPLLAGLAAVGAGMMGSSSAHGQWPVLFAVVGGALATVVNTLEHGGQMGMVFELFRNCFGFYTQLEEEIEKNLGEKDIEDRENGELFRMKMALRLGRSFSELKGLAAYASPSCTDEDLKEYAGKLY